MSPLFLPRPLPALRPAVPRHTAGAAPPAGASPTLYPSRAFRPLAPKGSELAAELAQLRVSAL